MKRALALLVLCAFGFLGFAQFSGTWSQTIRILPSVGLRGGSLTLNYAFAPGWQLTGITSFGPMDQCLSANYGITTQEFKVTGALGPINITSGMMFNANVQTWSCELCIYNQFTDSSIKVPVCFPVTSPDYMSAYFDTTLSLAGLNLGLRVDHWKFPYYLCGMPINIFSFYDEDVGAEVRDFWGFCFDVEFDPENPDLDGDGTPYEIPDDVVKYGFAPTAMLYTLTLGVSPVSITAHFFDCCSGINFGDLLLTIDDISLCCGISYDFELYFKKITGFEWARFKIQNFLSWCCGISFDLVVEFGVNYKELNLIPRFAGVGDGCVAFYFGNDSWFDIEGWKISCTLGDCSSLEIVTALEVPEDEPKTCEPPAWYDYNFVSTYGEWEYIKLKMCGPGCCGGTYTFTGQVWFGQGINDLFGISRIRGALSVPVMANLTVTGTFTYTLPTKSTTFDLGWNFTF